MTQFTTASPAQNEEIDQYNDKCIEIQSFSALNVSSSPPSKSYYRQFEEYSYHMPLVDISEMNASRNLFTSKTVIMPI